MSTVEIVFVVYGMITLCVLAYGIQEILMDKGKDDFGNYMRHRWDIPLLMATTWPLWVMVMWPIQAFDWFWKKIVKP